MRPSGCSIEPQESDSTGQRRRRSEQFAPRVSAVDDQALGQISQGHFHQRGRLEADVQQIGQQPANVAEGTVGRPAAFGEELFGSGADAFEPLFQFVEHGGPFGGAAGPLTQMRQLLVGLGGFGAVFGKGRLQGLERRVPLGGTFGPIGRLVSLSCARSAASSFRAAESSDNRRSPRVQAASVAATFDSSALVWLASVEAARICSRCVARRRSFSARSSSTCAVRRVRPALFFGQPPGHFAMLGFGRRQVLLDVLQLLLQIDGPHAHRRQLPAVAGHFLFQIVRAAALVLDRRLVGRDPLAILGDPVFAGPHRGVGTGNLRFQGESMRFQRFGLGRKQRVLFLRGGAARFPTVRAGP